MNLYLVQHGEAKSEEQDPERPLTAKGRKEAGSVAMQLAGAGVKPFEIFHSQKLRAVQTADIFSSHFHIRAVEMEGLKPNDDPKIARDFVQSQEKDIMLVGHLPHMDKLASLIVTGNENADIVAFRMAGAVCLVKEEKWRVGWMLTPELL